MALTLIQVARWAGTCAKECTLWSSVSQQVSVVGVKLICVHHYSNVTQLSS